MAAERGALSKPEFVSQMVASGVCARTASFVWDEAVYFYLEPLQPDPGDRWESAMNVDPEDLEDITAKFWKQQGWEEPELDEPVILPRDPSLLEFAQWLDRQRQLQQ